MICSKNCSCLLCRELQSCEPKNRKTNMKKSEGKVSDNFILRKAEAFKPSGALGFIRGAARMSVRHWQGAGGNKERPAPSHGTQPPRVSRAASCEQIFPLKATVNPDSSSSKMFKAPSCEQISKCRVNDCKPLFRIISESKFVGKSQNSDMYTGKEQAKMKRRRDDATYSKNTHEKYIPLPAYEPNSKYNGNTYTEMKPKFVDNEGRSKVSPIYQDVKKKIDKDRSGKPASVKVQSKKHTTDLAACFQELSKKSGHELRKQDTPTPSEQRHRVTSPSAGLVDTNHKVVIYFGDSMLRNQVPLEPPKYSRIVHQSKEDIYAKKLLEETGNLGISKIPKTSATADLINQINIDNEPIYSEITYNDRNLPPTDESVILGDEVAGGSSKVSQDDYNDNMVATHLMEDGVINVEFRDNFECARRWVDIINGNGEHDDGTPEADETLDWSFVQGWRKR